MIVLLTDFGESEYVGVMKGVIHSHCDSVTIIDLTHSITPQSIREAAWILLNSYKYFPKHSVFVCVVDPGVGTSRDVVLVETPEYVFIGPDNGLLYPTATAIRSYKVYSIDISPTASNTFHGRDVFAVIAGKYKSGVKSQDLGKPKKRLTTALAFILEGRTGEIVRVDRFGNIITNIPPEQSKTLEVKYESKNLRLPLVETYAEGPSRGLFLVVGSYGTLEIAAQNQSAFNLLPVTIGQRITIQK